MGHFTDRMFMEVVVLGLIWIAGAVFMMFFKNGQDERKDDIGLFAVGTIVEDEVNIPNILDKVNYDMHRYRYRVAYMGDDMYLHKANMYCTMHLRIGQRVVVKYRPPYYGEVEFQGFQ